MLDLPEPSSTSPSERASLRLENELGSFSYDHYMADFFDETIVKEHLNFVPAFTHLTKDKGNNKLTFGTYTIFLKLLTFVRVFDCSSHLFIV